MSVSRVSRVSRAAMFAAVCVVLAAAGHVLMSGSPLPWPVLALALLGTALAGWAFAGSERRRRTVVALTLATQTCLHIVFTLAQSAASVPAAPLGTPSVGAREWARGMLCGDPSPEVAARAHDLAVRTGLAPGTPMPPSHGHGAMAHDMAAMAGQTTMAGMHHMGGMSATASWGMVAAHALAALVCGVWLAQGERAVFRVLRAVADRTFVPLRLVLAVLPTAQVPPPPRRAVAVVRRLRSRLLVHTLATRGPPGALTVA
ncbi:MULTISPECIES: hypothetical protein [unclassified Streptomyces]|uniref:hypothetical protein n=1 Tax=unclassified Streptomyces TaxID=2593676 RepID=UPI0007DCE8BC|nr:hypothetical protein [Streptomyces sp. SAT1]ANH89737.1 hypothetical protein A8713_00150 [Streptomyces sp. SAT1]